METFINASVDWRNRFFVSEYGAKACPHSCTYLNGLPAFPTF